MTDIVHLPGAATFEESASFTQVELFNSANPKTLTEEFPVAQNTDLPIGAVVGVNGSGDLALAKTSSTAIAPIGVLAAPAKTGAGVTTKAPVFRAGNFNMAALTYHADYDTAAKKKAAFRGAAAPTNIIVRERL